MERIPVLRPLRVLVVDDCEDTTASLAWLLRAWGFVAVESNSGRDALGQAAEFLPDVALVDLMMPGMDGWAVARAFRDRAVVVVILSGCNANGVDPSPAGMGYALHMRKPFDLGELRRFLARTEVEIRRRDA